MLKTPQSPTDGWRECLMRPDCAKRLDCGVFTAAMEL